MKKYILISLLFHLSFFLFLREPNQLGDENLTKAVAISFVATKTSENPGSAIVAPKETPQVEKKEIVKPKEEKKEKKVEKKEIKSKVADKKEVEPEEPKVEEIVNTTDTNESKEKEDENTGVTVVGKGDETSEVDVFQGSNFMADGDGGYIALSSAGIHYEILSEVEPEYPSQAEKIGYGQTVKVKVKFLVGLKGNIEKIEILESHQKLGFDEEVKKAIKRWRFKPIYHYGKNIKVYFMKDFVFNPR